MILNRLILGLSTGSFYSLVALGIVIIYKTTGLMNFAFGNMAMFMAYIAYTFVTIGVGPVWALLFTIPVAALFGFAVEKYTLRPIRNLSHSSMLIITLGILMILEGLVVQIWGTQYKSFPELVTGRPFILRGNFGIVVFRRQDILVFSILIAVSVAIFFILKYTRSGIAIKAVSENENVAQLMGINPSRVFSISWMIGTAVGTVVALLGAPKTYVSPTMMLFYQLQGFTAAVLGGFDSFAGAILGGLTLGVIETFVGGYISNELKTTFSLALIIAVLLIRPQGFFGSREVRRV
ncbi:MULTISPECIES: branched-chain amino acid ABC transporter permease [Pseudothermotoga]|jgi:branched-chain amino acid transport system permease protein|uniref:Inner-membrane translocator n=4 Tax=Pseudothermotoga TaxID=1643951 RepID=A8F654_PSELT|nr:MULTISPECIES: branched-chain amino acid ABC transporter permease [Pseudothermotoga]ABV33638.1 inner-membrane translocator [Pseudothermotoga lettingae TMO]MDI3495187.1 branched-chain amino acid transport system permease protein [Pseudothermotoga sp.]MDK2883711.1 branched-chain amino acid transport system permease protein [Pseudothermotoga sp.]GLI49445.1 branched-chain amino acid ABC transporter permease [Pseudothermotoga lettingae TMO]